MPAQSAIHIVDEDGVVAAVHHPAVGHPAVGHPAAAPAATVVLAHGAGGNRDAAILVAYAEELCARGLVVARIDLPYRQRRPKGPPSPSSAGADRDGIRAACAMFRPYSAGPLIVGGHSYGGRQASMLLAEDCHATDRHATDTLAKKTGVADGLLLSSYPLHPPGKPEKSRTAHLPSITVPTLVIHGSSDPFATTDEISAAIALIPAPTRLVEIEKVGHSLGPEKKPTAPLTADAVEEFLMTAPRS